MSRIALFLNTKTKTMKVKITTQNGQTGLRAVGTLVDVPTKVGKHWVKMGWAKSLAKPRKKKKDVT